jgi:hypothetical protein
MSDEAARGARQPHALRDFTLRPSGTGGLASQASELIDAGLRIGVQSDLEPDELRRLLETARSRVQAAGVQLQRVLAAERRAAS